MPSGEEIQRALVPSSIDRWRSYSGTEKAEAQTFLNELFACYGSDRRELGAEFEFFTAGSGGFMDLHWPRGLHHRDEGARCRDGDGARNQVDALLARRRPTPRRDRPAARWVVICTFQRLRDLGAGPLPERARVVEFELAELPDRYDALAFLAGPTLEPSFAEHYRELTKDAAQPSPRSSHSLVDRSAAPPRRAPARSSCSRCGASSPRTSGCSTASRSQVDRCNELRSDRDRSSPSSGFLFRVLNQKGEPQPQAAASPGTQYVNGELFAQPAEVELNRDEIHLLLRRRPRSTGARSTRRSSARSLKESSGASGGGSSAPTTPTRSTS